MTADATSRTPAAVTTASDAQVEMAVAARVSAHRPVFVSSCAEAISTYRTYEDTYGTYVTERSQVRSVRTVCTHRRRPPIADQRSRSTLPKPEARQRYVEIGELVALEQIRKDSEALDDRSIALGPFARLDANVVAAQDGKTRGAISNLFGSQAAFQAETMALALSAGDWIEQIEYPAPGDFPTADAWVDAFFAGESARGPLHGGEPAVTYASLWALWLSVVPYGLWSERIRQPSIAENVQWLERLEQVLQGALDHFDMSLRDGTTLNDLACACAGLIEGVWLNQCLTAHHPSDPSEPIATVMRRSGRLLWLGATEPHG